MKRYVIFAGDRSFARGGALDYVMDFSAKIIALGKLQDDIQRVQAAVEYLRKWT